MPGRTRKISFKSKVVSEMEVLQKPERLITRYFQEARHIEDIVGIKEDSEEREIWRKYSKDRMKTVSVALVFCLHIGVDPPDTIPKPAECAKYEGWVDPFACHAQRALIKITQSVQKSYERWQPRARYKIAADPTTEDVRKLCLSMRRNAKDERVLFHYNGHGVPRPTSNGEIWVFNKTYTQYIPLSIYDLQSWMEYPSIYVWDCSSAETIINSFNRFADDHEREWQNDLQAHQESSSHPLPPISSRMTVEEQAEALRFRRKPRYKECIQLAACRVDERLPTKSQLPADLFTSCLTTPIQTSILWYLIRSGRRNQFPPNFIDEIPGALGDRRTVLGELNWIFTAITDTIAWNSLPKEDFQRLFRQDLLLASLFRSFILAEKIMGENGCRVVSSPALPSTSDHPLWESWEYTLDLTLNYIHNSVILPKIGYQVYGKEQFFSSSVVQPLNALVNLGRMVEDIKEPQYNWFFVEQLRAFEVWLDYGSDKMKPPQQLPIVLQVLLSQAHRLRALELLSRFLDLGQWAVAHALSVGVFPYVQKLLQSNTRDLRPWLGFIWAKILAVDPSCQTELFKENGDEGRMDNHHKPRSPLRYSYFVQILNDPETTPRQKIVPAFILAMLFHNGYKVAQENLTEKGYVNLCTELLGESKQCRLLKLWILIGLGRLWADFDKARWQAIRLSSYEKVVDELHDVAPEVRAAAVYALGCLVKNRSEDNEHASTVEQQICDDLCNKCTLDGSVLVRVELVVAIQWFVIDFEHRFAKMLLTIIEQREMTLFDGDDCTDMDVVDIAATIVTTNTYDPERSARGGRFQRKSESLLPEEEKICTHNKVDTAFRQRTRLQIDYLIHKTFHEPYEKIWLSVLRLSIDPCLKVASMAQTLVRRVEELAVRKLEVLDTKLEGHEIPLYFETPNSHTTTTEKPVKSSSLPKEIPKEVYFVVGSPANNNTTLPPTNPNVTPLSNQRKTSVASVNTPKSTQGFSPFLVKELVGKVFVPKRSVTGREDWQRNKQEVTHINHEPMISSEFVDWCSRVFVEPILDLIQASDADDQATDKLLTQVNPTDWAYHTREGIIQASADEFRKSGSFDHLLSTFEFKNTCSMAFSTLRKIVYFTDGDSISMATYDKKDMSLIREFSARGENIFANDYAVSLLVINDMSREMIVAGSNQGTLRVWDPMFNIHSHELEKEQKYITSAPLLQDLIRQPLDKRGPICLYDWCQESGKIFGGGNMRFVRIWDAQYEKTTLDVAMESKWGAVTSMSASGLDSSNLISVGFRRGAIDVHDMRIEAKNSKIMHYDDFQDPVITCSLQQEPSSGRHYLFSGTSAGNICVFDPRMFQEPMNEITINKEITHMDVHPSTQLMACATKDTKFEVKLMDIRGASQGNIQTMGSHSLAAVTSITMHKMRALVAVADRFGVSVYSKKYIKV